MSKEIMNLVEACEYTGLSKVTMLRAVRAKEVKHYRKTNKLIFFKKEDLDKWMLSNPVEAAKTTGI